MALFVNDGKEPLETLTTAKHGTTNHTGIAGVDPPAASQGEAEAGAETASRSFSPLRMKQAIAAQATTVQTFDTSGE